MTKDSLYKGDDMTYALPVMKNELPASIIVVFRDETFHEVARDEEDAKRLCFIREDTGRMTYRTITDAAQIKQYLRQEQEQDWREKHAE
jgi:hypothetical protein